jgi:hypothetical protein
VYARANHILQVQHRGEEHENRPEQDRRDPCPDDRGDGSLRGGSALLGRDPGYYVINWLLLYNYTVGILTVFITAILIWTNSRYALPAAIATFSVHALVMLTLQVAYRGIVAMDSIVAMTVRLIVWAIILALMFVQARKNQVSARSLVS